MNICTTGGPQIVRFLRPQGTVLLQKPYYSGTDLVLKLQFMTFGFSKSPFSHDLSIAHKYILVLFLTMKSPNLHYIINQILMRNPQWEILWNWWPNYQDYNFDGDFWKSSQEFGGFWPNLVKKILKFSRKPY